MQGSFPASNDSLRRRETAQTLHLRPPHGQQIGQCEDQPQSAICQTLMRRREHPGQIRNGAFGARQGRPPGREQVRQR